MSLRRGASAPSRRGARPWTVRLRQHPADRLTASHPGSDASRVPVLAPPARPPARREPSSRPRRQGAGAPGGLRAGPRGHHAPTRGTTWSSTAAIPCAAGRRGFPPRGPPGCAQDVLRVREVEARAPCGRVAVPELEVPMRSREDCVGAAAERELRQVRARAARAPVPGVPSGGSHREPPVPPPRDQGLPLPSSHRRRAPLARSRRQGHLPPPKTLERRHPRHRLRPAHLHRAPGGADPLHDSPLGCRDARTCVRAPGLTFPAPAATSSPATASSLPPRNFEISSCPEAEQPLPAPRLVPPSSACPGPSS